MQSTCSYVIYLSAVLLWLLTGSGYAHLDRDDSDNTEPDTRSFEIHMPGMHPEKDDEYICVAKKIPEGTHYITQYEALASGGTAHHLLLYGCEVPLHMDKTWTCGQTCKPKTEPTKIMFAWAKNAPPTNLPKDVAFEIGGPSKVNYLVLQIHYRSAFTDDQGKDTSGVRLTMTSQKQKYQAGVMIMLSTNALIPAHVPKTHVDVSCKYKGYADLHPFAFRVHAHDLSTVITGYMLNNTWTLMGKGNPQWPQAFYPMQNEVTIKPNDYLVARCTYDASDRSVDTKIGSTHNDEMCNFYFMYYTEYGKGETYLECFDNNVPKLLRSIPDGSDVPPPRNPALEDEASGHHHHHGDDENGVEPQPEPRTYPELKVVHDWPQINQSDSIRLGQVAGVALDSKGNVHIFHRGAREWDSYAFDNKNKFRMPDSPINKDVLVTFSPDGKVIDQWGADMFYMPHGIYIDKDDNIWLTDVAMHQVFRFPPDSHTADRMYGTRMEPGSDDNHFCKPTDVTVISTGEVFITDGYCNSRVMKYSADGLLVKQWGTHSKNVQADGYPTTGTFDLPHSITDVHTHKMVCVADRENQRIQCFDYDGKFVKQYHPDTIKGPIYAIDYCPDYDVLLVVNGPDNYKKDITISGYTLDVTSGKVVQTWSPDNKGFKRPHDVTVGHQGNVVYVAEIGPNKIWKFNLNGSEPRHPNHPQSVDASADESTEKRIEETNETDFGASIVIGALLVIPVLVIVIIVVFLRVRKQRREVGYKLVMPDESDTDSEGEDELFLKSHPNQKHVSFSPEHSRKAQK